MQRVVHLKNPRAVAILREATGELRGETVARDAQQLVGGDVAEDGFVLLNRGQILNACRSLDCAAERRKVRTESVGERLRAASRNGPTHRMRGSAESDTKGSAQGLIETQEGMRGKTSEERLGAFAAEKIGKRFC